MSLGFSFLLSNRDFQCIFMAIQMLLCISIVRHECTQTVMLWARGALKVLICFDSGDKISGCLLVEEQFVLNNFIYQKCACFAVHSTAI